LSQELETLQKQHEQDQAKIAYLEKRAGSPITMELYSDPAFPDGPIVLGDRSSSSFNNNANSNNENIRDSFNSPNTRNTANTSHNQVSHDSRKTHVFDLVFHGDPVVNIYTSHSNVDRNKRGKYSDTERGEEGE